MAFPLTRYGEESLPAHRGREPEIRLVDARQVGDQGLYLIGLLPGQWLPRLERDRGDFAESHLPAELREAIVTGFAP